MDPNSTRYRYGRAPQVHLQRLMRSLAGAGMLALAGCGGIQSALDPAGADAAQIYRLTIVLSIGGAVIFLAITCLLLYAIFAQPGRRAWLGTGRTVVVGGLAFPIVVLSALLPYGLVVMRDTDVPVQGALRIEVIGEQFWWRVRYPAERDQPEVITANELRLPVGRPVSVSVTSPDVIHSFWIPSLAGKIDMIPGRINRINFTVDRPGVYRGVCAEYCGAQHARMAFDVIALDAADFASWREEQARPALEPSTPFLQQGQTLFRSGGCGNCHTVRGTEAEGRLGPDLTHVASRRTIGAGQFPTNVGTLAGWVANTQQLKPGVRMPSYGMLLGKDLRALASYLESLK